MTQSRPDEKTPLGALVEQCRLERRGYSAAGADVSPACVELTRRSLAGDQEAWAAFSALFEPLMRAWIGVQQTIEPDDVLQEALLAFARWAPAHRELTSGEELGRALAFLRRCTKTALLTQVRKAKQPPWISLDSATAPAPHNDPAAVERRLVIGERLGHLLATDTERLVVQELLIDGAKPRDIFARHGERFGSIEELRVVIQRVVRRLRNDGELQELR